MRDVPVLHWVLAAEAVRDVWVVADAISLRRVRAEDRQAVADLRSEDEAGQPRRLGSQDRVELVHPGLGEALRREPHLRLRMELPEAGGLLLEKRHQVLRLCVTGISAGHEDRVDARQFREDLRPFLQRELDLFGIAVVLVERGIPDPHVLRVLVREARHLHHHVHLRQRKMRAVGGIVRSGWDELNRVRAEDREIADVLLPHRHVPRVVGVGLRAIAELMAAQRDLRGRDDVEAGGNSDGAALHAQLAQQSSDAEEHAAGVRAKDEHGRRTASSRVERDAVSFASRCSGGGRSSQSCAGPSRSGRERSDGDRRNRGGRPLGGDRHADVRALRDLFDEDPDGGALLEVEAWRASRWSRG